MSQPRIEEIYGKKVILKEYDMLVDLEKRRIWLIKGGRILDMIECKNDIELLYKTTELAPKARDYIILQDRKTKFHFIDRVREQLRRLEHDP